MDVLWVLLGDKLLLNLPSNTYNLLSPHTSQTTPIHACLPSASLLKWRWLADSSNKAIPVKTKGTDSPAMHGSSIWARFLCLQEMPALFQQSLIERAIIKPWHTYPWTSSNWPLVYSCTTTIRTMPVIKYILRPSMTSETKGTSTNVSDLMFHSNHYHEWHRSSNTVAW